MENAVKNVHGLGPVYCPISFRRMIWVASPQTPEKF